jgi:DNA-binding NtrC family response regulator
MSEKLKPLAVLVIDDEPLIRWAVSEALCEAGHAVVEASDGDGGIEVVSTAPRPFDVVFLDFRFQDPRDFTLLTTIRTWAPWSAVVLMTVHGTAEMIAEASRLGVYRVLSKPFDLVEVHNVVASVSAAGLTSG